MPPHFPPRNFLALLRDFFNDHHPLIADKITRVNRVNCSTESQPSGHPLDIQPGSHVSRLYLGRDRRFLQNGVGRILKRRQHQQLQVLKYIFIFFICLFV